MRCGRRRAVIRWRTGLCGLVVRVACFEALVRKAVRPGAFRRRTGAASLPCVTTRGASRLAGVRRAGSSTAGQNIFALAPWAVEIPARMSLKKRKHRFRAVNCLTKDELESGIAEYLAFCRRERTAARASELASFLKVGYRNLRRLSNRVFGVSVVTMLRLRQMEYSVELLRDTSMSIEEIRQMAGFGDRRTFFRAVRRRFECSPMAVRKDGQRRP